MYKRGRANNLSIYYFLEKPYILFPPADQQWSYREANRDLQPNLTSSAGSGTKVCLDLRFRTAQVYAAHCELCNNTKFATSIGRLIQCSRLLRVTNNTLEQSLIQVLNEINVAQLR